MSIDAEGNALAAWRVIVVGVLALTLVLGQLYVVLPMLDELARFSGASTATLAVTAFALPYAAGFLLFGPLSDRFGPRMVMIVSVGVVLTGTLVVCFAPNWPVFLVGRVVQGFAAAPFTPAILVLTQTRVAPAHRLVTTSAIISAGMASAVVAQVSAQLALPTMGVTGVFGLFATVIAMCMVLVMVLIPRASPLSPTRRTSASIADVYRTIPRLLSQPRLVLLFVAALSYLTVFVGLYAALQLSGRTDDPGELLVLRISALPAIAAVPLLSPLLARVAVRTRLLASMAVAGTSTLVVGLLATAGLLSIPVFGLGMLVTAGAIAIAAPATVTEVMAAAPGAGGAANALYSTAIFGGASMGAPLAEFVISLVGAGDTGIGAYALTSSTMLALALTLVFLALSGSRP
ncbi:MFS transporter [Micropruina sp.]|uniref:MFS transporter n=1 Tax=Micropruina sp. TaxID=2737536 RepID=UPI0039E676C7